MKKIFPQHLGSGDEVRVIAPSSSLGIIGVDVQKIANKRLASLGLKLSFGKHASELDEFGSSSIESRIADLHDAFADTAVKAVLCVIGGFNCNQLLPYIDWELIRRNPKPFIGYSDITVLLNAMLANAGLVTYLGPAYSTFGQKLGFDFTMEHFEKCLMQNKPFTLKTADKWSDDEWYLDQENRVFFENHGPYIIQSGKATAELVGGNLSSFVLLFGTSHTPSLAGKILCIEDDGSQPYRHIDRNLEALLQQPGADSIAGIVIGRFQKGSEMAQEKIRRLIVLRSQLAKIPVVANFDFGHTSPLCTLPIGGIVSIDTSTKDIFRIEEF